jgi:DNA-3-methyladenine glycosylase II
MSKPGYWDEATRSLSRVEPGLRRLVRAYPGIHLKRRSDPFTTLARAIVGQQISVKAADAIWNRFVARVSDGPTRKFPRLDPTRVIAVPLEELRLCGLSQG